MNTLEMDAIVLAGGQGRRLGTAGQKPFLPLGEKRLVEWVLSFLRPRFRSIIVVTRRRDGWEWLEDRLVTDDRPEGGPLVGLVRGLAATDTEWCFLVGCDMPFLQAPVVEAMARRAGQVDAVALRTGRLYHPLHAFYRRTCLPVAEELLGSGTTSVQELFRHIRTQAIGPEELRRLDPDLISFRDVDTPEDYLQALRLDSALTTRRER